MKLLRALPATTPTSQRCTEPTTAAVPQATDPAPMAPRSGGLPGAGDPAWTATQSAQPSAVLGAQWPRTAVKTAAACLLGAAFLLAPKLAQADECPPGQYPTNTGCVADGLEQVPILPIERALARVGDTVSKMAEHTKGKRNSTKDKHTKPRAGRTNTKNRKKGGWVQNPNKRK